MNRGPVYKENLNNRSQYSTEDKAGVNAAGVAFEIAEVRRNSVLLDGRARTEDRR
jgi:hypothetical protein